MITSTSQVSIESALSRADNPIKANPYYLKNDLRNIVLLDMFKMSKSWQCAEGTYSLSVAYLDFMLQERELNNFELGLMGFVCLYLAVKFNEKWDRIPSREQIESIYG